MLPTPVITVKADAVDAPEAVHVVEVVAALLHLHDLLAGAVAAVAALPSVADRVSGDVNRVGGVVHSHLTEGATDVPIVYRAGAKR